MAATAESIRDQLIDWEVHELEFEPAHANLAWIDSDSVTALSDVRIQSDQVSADILKSRMQSLREGDVANVPYAVDSLSTAALAVDASEKYGTASAEYAEKRRGIVLDCERLLAEAHRKLSWEYFARERQVYDPERRSYMGYGRALIDIVTNGITPVAEPEEQDCRIAERREEVTVRHIGEMLMKATGVLSPEAFPQVSLADELVKSVDSTSSTDRFVSVLTISECTDWAIDAYEKNPDGAFDGYAPPIEKLMVRVIHIDPTSGSRYEEQVGVSGLYINHKVINRALQMIGVIPKGRELTKTEVRGKQLINTSGGSALEMLALLDQLASEDSRQLIFMGEPVDASHLQDYDAVPDQAANRQIQQQSDAEVLADFVMELAANGTDSWAANALVGRFVTKQIFEAVKGKPQEAAIAFDAKTAAGVQEVSYLRSIGHMNQANYLEQVVEAKAPPAGFCGAGSCGIVGVDASSADGLAAKALGLKAENGELLKDSERSCPDCNKMEVMYDSKGNKVCINVVCNLRRINGRISGGTKPRKAA